MALSADMATFSTLHQLQAASSVQTIPALAGQEATVAELQFPDIVGRFQQGQRLGTQQRLQREGEQRQSRLAALAQQAYGAPPDQRQDFIRQAIGVDQEAGLALGKSLQGDDERREGILLTNARLIDAAPDEMKESIFQRVRPQLEPYLPGLPPVYGPQVGEGVKAFIASRQSAQGGTPAQQRHQEWLLSQLPESERPEALKYFAGLGSRPLQESYTWEQIETDQGPRWVQRGRLGTLGVRGIDGAGAVASQSGPPGSAAAPVPEGSGGAFVDDSVSLANQMSAAGIPDQQIEAFLNNRLNPPASAQVQPQGGSARPLTSAERKYAEESGQQAAQIEVLDQRGRIEAANAARKAAAEAAAKTQAEVTAKQGQRSRDAQQTLDLLDQAEQILPQATGSGAGAATDRVAGVLGISTPGAQATAQLNLIASQLVQKVPRFEGPQSNIDVQFYREAAGDLANPNLPVETRLAALRGMRALNQKYAGGGAAQQSRSSLPPGFSWED